MSIIFNARKAQHLQKAPIPNSSSVVDLRSFRKRPLRRRLRIALLIDAENIGRDAAPEAIRHLKRYGTICISKVYGPPSLINSKGWLQLISDYSITPSICKGCVKGKNSVDMRMTIEAMDILNDGMIGTFAIVSTDSDFLPLVQRLKAARKRVIVFGRGNANPAYKEACDIFVAFDDQEHADQTGKQRTSTIARRLDPYAINGDLAEFLRSVSREIAPKGGWCDTSLLSQRARQHCPWFSAKAFGYRKLHTLLERTAAFEIMHKNGRVYAKAIVKKR